MKTNGGKQETASTHMMLLKENNIMSCVGKKYLQIKRYSYYNK